MKYNPTPYARGFTVMELLTSIAVVVILALILIPVVGKIRYNANAVEGANNLRGIGSAFGLHIAQYNGQLPEATITSETWNERHPNPADHVKGDQMWTKLLRDFLPQENASPTARENKIFVCPNAEYIRNGQVLAKDEIARTYTASEVLYGQDPSGVWSKEHRRNINSIYDTASTIVVVDAKAYKGSNASLSVLRTRYMGDDQGVESPEATTYLDFRQPGETLNVLYVDGHVERLDFPMFQALEEKNWDGRD